MNFRRKWFVLVPAAILATFVVAGAWWHFTRDPQLREYPDPPFPPLAKDYPRIIATDQAPSRQNVEAYDQYREERRAINKYLREGGAMRQATEDEREAYRLVVQGTKYVEGRDLAVKSLQQNPQSIPARFVLAVAEEEGEGNFARALFLIRKLRHEMHRRGVENPQDEEAREWYLRILERESYILTELNRDEEKLRVVELMEQLYEPLAWRRVWPLMRLGRFDEARQWLDKADEAGRMRRSTLNLRLSLEYEAGRRKEAFEAGKAAAELESESQVILNNYAGMAAYDFHFPEAEEALLRATSKKNDYWGTPFSDLALLLAGKGQLVEAWDTLRRAQVERRKREPYTLIADQHRFEQRTATVLFLGGYAEAAYQLARHAHDRPQRDNASSQEVDYRFVRNYVLWLMLRNYQAELKEFARFPGIARNSATTARALQLERWDLEHRLWKLLADDAYLVRILRAKLLHPGIPDVIMPPVVFMPDLMRILPAGVSVETLRRARQAEPHPSAVPYFDAVEAEMAWTDGRFSEALELAHKALKDLSTEYERPLRARVSVVAGDCLVHLGQIDEAMSQFDQALRTCPAMFRFLEVPIPVVIAEDGSPLASRWAEALLECSRFRGDPRGFSLVLRSAGEILSFELFRIDEGRHCQGTVPAAGRESDVVALATRRLVHRLMSPSLDLSTTDIHSLDNGLFAAPSSNETERLLRLATPR